MKRNSIFLILVIAASMLFLTTSCFKDEKCVFKCASCEIESDDCQCLPDSSYGCPPGINGWYNYGSWFYPECSCICNPGWAGANCDQRDTNYYIRFRHGDDTLSLSELITTSDYIQSDSTQDFFYKGYFPAGGDIDTIAFRNMYLYAVPPIGSFPLCEADSCNRLELVFGNGASAYSFSGTMTIDTFLLIPTHWGGTFKANLSISGTGQNYYVREGTFFLPIIFYD